MDACPNTVGNFPKLRRIAREKQGPTQPINIIHSAETSRTPNKERLIPSPITTVPRLPKTTQESRMHTSQQPPTRPKTMSSHHESEQRRLKAFPSPNTAFSILSTALSLCTPSTSVQILIATPLSSASL